MKSFKPTVGEIKVASIVVHAQELLSVDGREADRQANAASTRSDVAGQEAAMSDWSRW